MKKLVLIICLFSLTLLAQPPAHQNPVPLYPPGRPAMPNFPKMDETKTYVCTLYCGCNIEAKCPPNKTRYPEQYEGDYIDTLVHNPTKEFTAKTEGAKTLWENCILAERKEPQKWWEDGVKEIRPKCQAVKATDPTGQQGKNRAQLACGHKLPHTSFVVTFKEHTCFTLLKEKGGTKYIEYHGNP